MRKISVEPQQVLKVAERVDASNDDYQRLYRDLYAKVDLLAGVWKGKDNVAFVEEIRSYESNFQRISIIMRQYSDFLRRSISAYEGTQNELYTQARQLRR